MYEIEFYQDAKGKSDVYEYMISLKKKNTKDSKIKAKKIDLYLDLLSEYGLEIKEPYIKKIDDQLWELRPLKDRFLFVSWKNHKFILLSVFVKQTQKTPTREILKAKNRLKELHERGDF